MTTIRNFKQLLCLLLALLTFASEAAAAPALGDYNGDGRSDFAVALVNRQTNSTAWLSRLGETQSLFWTFGRPGDALVTGKWFGDGKVYPGIVWVRDARAVLEWYLKTPAGGEVLVGYGLPGDTVPNQGDLDCDGTTDFTVVRNGTAGRFPGSKIWYVALSSLGGQVAEVPFGLTNDRVGVADMDGDGCAEQIALRDGYLWFTKKLFGTAVTQVQWGLPGDYPMMPLDINVDGQADYMISRAEGAIQRIYVRYSANSTEIFNAGLATSIPMAGNFIGAPSFAWSQRDTGFIGILNFSRQVVVYSFGIAANAIIRPDGTVVQPSESGRFGTPSTPGGGGGTDGGGGGGNIGSLRCDSTLDMTDGSGGNKYRPSSSRGRKMLWQRSLYGSIQSAASFDSNGNKFDDWEVYGSPEPTAGPRTRAYNRKSPGAAPKPEIIVARLSNGQQVCGTVPDPTREVD